MHALLILGMTEELGQGIKLMKRALKANGNSPPEFISNPDQFKVIFHRQKRPVAEGDVRKVLDEYFSGNEFISRRQIEELCGVGSTNAKYLIEKLISEKYLCKIGNGPSTKYGKA